MNYEDFISKFEAEEIDNTCQDLYDFACLKIARHSLARLISKNDFDFKTEQELQDILKLLNKIHENNTQLKKEFENEKITK